MPFLIVAAGLLAGGLLAITTANAPVLKKLSPRWADKVNYKDPRLLSGGPTGLAQLGRTIGGVIYGGNPNAQPGAVSAAGISHGGNPNPAIAPDIDPTVNPQNPGGKSDPGPGSSGDAAGAGSGYGTPPSAQPPPIAPPSGDNSGNPNPSGGNPGTNPLGL